MSVAAKAVQTAASETRARPLARLVARLDDWLNPMLVKELRQAVRAKYVIGLFLLFLIGQLAAMSIYITQFGRKLPLEAGQTIFWILFALVTGTCTLLVPLYCGGRLSIERARGGAELFYATALRPRSILWGKLLSGLVITILIYSACAPFMVLTYLLRGIDLPTIFASLGGGFLASAFCILVALFIASMPIGNVLKVLLAIFAFFNLPFFPSLLGVLMFAVLLGGPFGGWGPAPWASLLLVLLMAVVGLGHLFVWTLALLSPLSANRALPMRAFITGAWLLTGIVAVLMGSETVAVWSVLGASSFCLMYYVAVCERVLCGPRVARTIPRRRWLRPLAFLLYSGAAGGVAWSSVMLLLTLGVVLAAASGSFGAAEGAATAIAGMALPAFAATMSALLLRNATFPRYQRAHTWAVAVAIHMLGSVILLLISAHYYVALGAAWALLVGLAGVPWFMRQARAFRPYTAEMAARLADLLVPVAPRAVETAPFPGIPPIQYGPAPSVQHQTSPPVQHER